MPDFDNDEEPWTAYFVNPANCPWSLTGYVYQPSRRMAAFRFLARLCLVSERLEIEIDKQVLHDVIMELYSTEGRLSSRQRIGFVTRTQLRLDELWKEVPSEMKFKPAQASPPPWIFMFQCVKSTINAYNRLLYHATSILLHRPMLQQSDIPQAKGHVATCLEHSITANQMALSYTTTFGERMTYIAVYSSFVAA